MRRASPARGFVFYTNFESAKGAELLAVPKAALCFHWKSLRRQVRVRGHVSRASDAEADAYFATRARGSRLGAWASQQSRTLESRFALEKAVAAVTRAIPHRRNPPPALLVGLPHHASRDGVLARPSVPPARARRLPARGRRARRGEGAAVSVIGVGRCRCGPQAAGWGREEKCAPTYRWTLPSGLANSRSCLVRSSANGLRVRFLSCTTHRGANHRGILIGST